MFSRDGRGGGSGVEDADVNFDRYVQNATVQIFKFIMFIFKKRQYLRSEQWARVMRVWQSNSRDVIERERARKRERERERERDGEGGGARCVRCLENAESSLSIHIQIIKMKKKVFLRLMINYVLTEAIQNRIEKMY